MRVVPDLLTLLRVAASPLLAWLLLQAEFRLAVLVVFLAGLTDWLDGYTARRLHVTGKFGTVLDPLADKTMLVTLFVVLGVVGLIPVWLVVLVIGRDVVIVAGALLIRIFREIRKFRPSLTGKISTFFQIVFVLLVLLRAAFSLPWLLWPQNFSLVLTTLFTALSGIGYVRRGIRMAARQPA